jgi:ubiquinone/menaquinone biosynthesis C-methylase UbiE
MSSSTDSDTVSAYSRFGAQEYEDPANRQFLYGAMTVEFLNTISLRPDDRVVVDLGAGTGFVFEELGDQFRGGNRKGVGIEPAAGMRAIAEEKFAGDKAFSIRAGSFEQIPMPDHSADTIISTLALHWVKALPPAAAEMDRVLRDDGRLRVLMIEKSDGAEFKKAIVRALRRHLSFKQIMKTATLVQRVDENDVIAELAALAPRFDIRARTVRRLVHGTFEQHMKWWTARSAPVIHEVEDKPQFMDDLRREMEATETADGIPFDASFLWIEADSNMTNGGGNRG